MGCQASRTAGPRAVVATPANLKNAINEEKPKQQNIEINIVDGHVEGKDADDNQLTEEQLVKLEHETDEEHQARVRALSAANTTEKTTQMNEAHTPANTNQRRKLTILSTKSKGSSSAGASSSTQKKNKMVKVEGDGGIGNGSHGFASKSEHLPINFSVVTRPGNDPQKKMKENQDNYCVVDKYGKETSMCVCVFDGHGPNGAYASAFVRDMLPSFWLKSGITEAADDDAIKQVLHDGCVHINKRLAVSEIDVYVSGTTGILGYLRDNRLFVANVGDSRAVLGRRIGDKILAIDLSDDHKPDRPDEETRILTNGGRVFEWGVPRVWKRDVDMPGLAMARSFGDLAAESVGVFAEPEISVTDLCSDDVFVIFATDGVWEFLSSQQVVDIIGKSLRDNENSSPEKCHKAAIDTIKQSVKQWGANEDVVDDSTCAILSLNFPHIRVDVDI